MKILFVAEAATFAHVVRPLTLAKLIRDYPGYEIAFACDSRYEKIVLEAGISFFSIHSIGVEKFLARIKFPFVPLYSRKELETYVQEELALFKSFKPDIVIGEFRHTLSISCTLMKIPYMTIVNAYWNPEVSIIPHVPDFKYFFLIGEKVSQKIFESLYGYFQKLHAKPYRALQRKFSLPEDESIYDVYMHADRVLHPDLQRLYPQVVESKKVHFIGPILPNFDLFVPAYEHKEGQPLIYVSMGSSGGKGVVEKVLASLVQLPVRVLVASGESELNNPAPEKIWIEKYLPAEKILSKADLMISHGGSVSADQALAAGVPVLGIASNLDHFISMELLCGKGVAKKIRASSAKEKNIAAAIMEMLEDIRFRKAAKEISKEYASYDVKKELPKLINEVFSH